MPKTILFSWLCPVRCCYWVSFPPKRVFTVKFAVKKKKIRKILDCTVRWKVIMFSDTLWHAVTLYWNFFWYIITCTGEVQYTSSPFRNIETSETCIPPPCQIAVWQDLLVCIQGSFSSLIFLPLLGFSATGMRIRNQNFTKIAFCFIE